MDINEYQIAAKSTAIFPPEFGIPYCTMKLCGEAGEHAEKVAKSFRGDYTIEKKKEQLAYELGDVLWYVANLADLYGYSLDEIAEMNLTKLKDRQVRNVLRGDGDNR